MNQVIDIEWLDDSENSKTRYNYIFNNVIISNIPQIWDYGDVKKHTENSSPIRGIIKVGNVEAGTIQILVKQRCGIPFAWRINRGPLFLEQYDNPCNHIEVLRKIRSRIPHPIPLVCAPSLEYTPENIVLLTRDNWKQWNPYGYETGVLDLEKSVDDIRKGLDAKWRNQLKASEKNHLEIKNGFTRFDEMIGLYELNQKEKGYAGIPREVLKSLKNMPESPLVVFYITNETDEIIAFDIFYYTNNFGLYFVGWNDDEGRRMYVNNLLLFNAVRFFKEKGIKWLDLGGIDYIETEENARFKDGMRPRHIRLVGEFVKL